MKYIRGFVMSVGMFTIMPVPFKSWNEKYSHLVIPSLPIVGVLVGSIWFALAYLLTLTTIPTLMLASSILFLPYIITGFIHVDGFMDTTDAVYSRRDLEEKKRILKDSRTGAFAVIFMIGIVLLQFSAVYTILDAGYSIMIFVFLPAVSRCVAGITMLNIKPIFETGYNVTFKENTRPSHTVFICVILCLLQISAWFVLGFAMLPLLVEVIVGVLLVAYLYKQFKGISGDLCGFIIVVSELAALLTMACL